MVKIIIRNNNMIKCNNKLLNDKWLSVKEE